MPEAKDYAIFGMMFMWISDRQYQRWQSPKIFGYIIKRPIAVYYEDAAGQTLFGEEYLEDSADTVDPLIYPDSDNSPGHCDLLVTEEKQERQPKDLPKAGIYVIIRVGK